MMFVSISSELISDVSGASPRDFARLQALDLHLREHGSDSDSDARPPPKIRKIEKLSLVPNLRQLNLSYNAITRIEGLEMLRGLVELNLAENAISVIENLESLSLLERLNLSGNEIARIPPSIAQLRSLTHLRLARNRLCVPEDVQHLERLQRLAHLRLDDNPLAADEQYALYTVFHVPSLLSLDGVEVSERRRDQARLSFAADHAQRLRHRLAAEQRRLARLRREIQSEVGTAEAEQIPREMLQSRTLSLKLEEARGVEQSVAQLQRRIDELATASASAARSISLPYYSSPETEDADADSDQLSRLRSATHTPALERERERERESLAGRQILTLNEKVERLASKVMTAEKEKQELRSQLSEQQSSARVVQDLKSELRDVERDLEQALEAAQKSNEECVSLREELRQSALKVTERDAQIAIQSQRIADLQEELCLTQKESSEYQRLVQEMRENSRAARSASSVSTAEELRAQEARVRALSQRLDQDDLERQSERLQREVDDCRLQASSLNDALLRARENYDTARQKLSSLEKKVIEKDEAMHALQRENHALASAAETLRAEQRSLERENQTLRAKIESLENDFRSMLKAQRSTPQKAKKMVVPLSLSRGAATLASTTATPAVRRAKSHYLDVDSTDSEERDLSPVRRAGSRSPPAFTGSQLDKSAAEIVAHILLEELQSDPHFFADSAPVKEACIRSALRLLHTSSALQQQQQQAQGDEGKHGQAHVELTPFQALGDRDFLSRLVAEAHSGLAALEDAVQVKEQIKQLERVHRDFESKITSAAQTLAEKEKAVQALEKHASEARRQAEATLEDLEALHRKLQATRDEVVQADAEQAITRRELDIARHNLKECLALNDVENKNISQLRERLSQLQKEHRSTENLLSQTKEQQAKEEHKLRNIKQTISEEIRLMQMDINKLQQEFRRKQMHMEDYEKQRKLQEEESDIRKRELDAYLAAKAREVEDEVRRLNSARNDLRITKLESETALSRKKQIEYELAQLQEKLHVETSRFSAEEREAQQRLEQAEKRTQDTERALKALRDKLMLLESERQLQQQAVDDLKRAHNDLEKAAEKKRKTADDEFAQLQQQVQIATRNYRQMVAQIESKQHDYDAALSDLRAVERKNEEAKRVSRELQSKQDHLKDEVQFFSQEKDKLQKEVAQLKKAEEDLRQHIFLLRASSEHESKLTEDIRRKANLLQNEELALHESEQKMKSVLSGLKKQIDDHAASLDSMSAAAERERRNIQELSTKRTVLEKEIFQLEERAKSSRERKQEESARQQDIDHQMVKSMDEMNRIAKQVIQFEQKIDSMLRRESELKAQEQSIQSQLSKLHIEYDGLKGQISTEKTSYMRLKEECAQVSLQISDHQQELAKLNESVLVRRQEVDAVKLQVQHFENIKRQVEQDVMRYQEHNQIEMKRLEKMEEAYMQMEKQLKVLRSELVATEDAYEKTRSLSLEESRKVEQQRQTMRHTMEELERLESSIQDAHQHLEMQKHRAIDEIGKLDQAKRSAQTQMFLMSEGQKRLSSKTGSAAPPLPAPPAVPFVRKTEQRFALPPPVVLERAPTNALRSSSAPVWQCGAASDDESTSSNSASFQLSSLQKAVENLRAQSATALSATRNVR